MGAERHRRAGCAAVHSRRGRLASGRHRAAPRVGAESRCQGPIVGAQVLLSLPQRERAADAGHAPVPELRAVSVVPLRAPLLSGARLNDTTIFLPNFPAELTGACEGQGACPGSLSKTAKPLASGPGRGTLVPAPGCLTRGSFINNGNNRLHFLLPGLTPAAVGGHRRRRLRGLSGGSVGSSKGTCNSRRRTWRARPLAGRSLAVISLLLQYELPLSYPIPTLKVPY